MAEHQFNLDPYNPGQYFACCGLFELSELAAPGGEAWFADEGRKFVISTDGARAASGARTRKAGGRPLR